MGNKIYFKEAILIYSTKKELEELLIQLEILRNQEGVYFRGQEDSSWELRPKAYRSKEVQKRWQEFSEKTLWISKIPAILEKSFSPYPIPLFIICKNKIIYIENVVKLFVDVMYYNQDVYLFQEQYAHCLSEKEIKERKEKMRGDAASWVSEDRFNFLCSSLYLLADITLVPDKFYIKFGCIEIYNGSTAAAESFCQHYGNGTTYLDWTRNPYIALWFASQKITKCDEGEIISLFCYIQKKTSENMRIAFPEAYEDIKNDRVRNQEGVFSYFPKANEFFLFNGAYPSVEDYLKCDDSFEIKRFNIQVNEETIQFCKKALESRAINEKFLFPDLTPHPAPLAQTSPARGEVESTGFPPARE
jgi:hypothetical protein